MLWWQQILGYVVMAFGGVVLGAWLQRRTLKEERLLKEQAELGSAVRGLLAEVDANLRLVREPLNGWSLAPFATDMWSVHRGKLTSLPLELQESLQQTYLWIGKANAVVQTHLAHDSRGGGHFDELYRDMAGRMEAPAQRAKDEMHRWLGTREKQLR